MYSEALAILDRNTEIYMCEELKKEVESLTATLIEKKAALAEKDTVLAEKDTALAEKDAALTETNAALTEKDAALSAALSETDHWKKMYQDLVSKN